MEEVSSEDGGRKKQPGKRAVSRMKNSIEH
jgi:hypothetical protein